MPKLKAFETLTVGELKRLLENLPDETQIAFVVREARGVLYLLSVDEWEEGVTIVLTTNDRGEFKLEGDEMERELGRVKGQVPACSATLDNPVPHGPQRNTKPDEVFGHIGFHPALEDCLLCPFELQCVIAMQQRGL